MTAWAGEELLTRLSESRTAGRLRALRGVIRQSEVALTAIAALLGGVIGLIVTGMSRLVQQMHVVLFGIDLNEKLSGAADLEPWRVLLWPVVGGAVMGLSFWLVGRLKRAYAVDPIESNALHGGRMSLLDGAAVALQSIISNGFGGSVGLEAGYTQAGSGLSSTVGQQLKLRRNDLRVMVGAGAAAAIAAAFGAPVAGAFYGFEVIIGTYAIAHVAPVMAAAITGHLVSQALGGTLYHIDAGVTQAVESVDYALYLVLGVVCTFLAVLLMRLVWWIERGFRRTGLPMVLRPVVGGLLVGALALVTPQALSAGHGALDYNLATELTISALMIILGVKMLASAVTLGSGFRGGLFFAAILLGAVTGLIFHQLLLLAGPSPIDRNSAALVGMGAFAVAVVGGPLTMAFLVLETTGNYGLTGAVLATCVVCSLLVRETFGYSFSTWRLHLRGESIRSAHDVGWIRSLTVGRLMRKDPATAPADITLKEFRRRFPLGSRKRVLLLDEAQRYLGLVEVAEAWAKAQTNEEMKAIELAKLKDAALTPEMNVKQAMAAFDLTEAEALPVIASGETGRVIGLLNEAHAVRRYAEELDKTRRELIGEPG
jgi:chloride channel protein, CIC family